MDDPHTLIMHLGSASRCNLAWWDDPDAGADDRWMELAAVERSAAPGHPGRAAATSARAGAGSAQRVAAPRRRCHAQRTLRWPSERRRVRAKTYRESQAVELVWTGPLVSGATMRRTDQALLEVINNAQQSLLIVSFAVYKIPAIATAIVHAAGRGVAIRICVEAPEPSGQKMAYDTIKALGPEVAQHAALYVWPSDQRPHDANGHAGVLHAKCAIADGQCSFSQAPT